MSRKQYKTLFDMAWAEYTNLRLVPTDYLDTHSVADMVFRAEDQIILYHEGEIPEDENITTKDIRKIERFIARWKHVDARKEQEAGLAV